MSADTNGLQQRVNDFRKLAHARRIFCHVPGRGLFNVVVGGMDKLHDHIFGSHIIHMIHTGGVAPIDTVSHCF